jgi:hypothetical protein
MSLSKMVLVQPKFGRRYLAEDYSIKKPKFGTKQYSPDLFEAAFQFK